jgi:CHAT domain-containing protein/tetratricopeptide (TPR) repeat protein
MSTFLTRKSGRTFSRVPSGRGSSLTKWLEEKKHHGAIDLLAGRKVSFRRTTRIMVGPGKSDVMQLLARWSGSDREALDALLPVVYGERGGGAGQPVAQRRKPMPSLRWALVMVGVAVGVLAAETRSAASQKRDDVRTLEPGKPIERELAGSESHSYRLTLASGQYARVVVDQQRINVAVSAFDSDGKKLVEADMFPVGDLEVVSLVAETSGSYRLEVRSPGKTAPKGRYEIKIKELRAATERDKSAVAAERLVADGMLLANQQTADSRRQAIEKYQQSIPLWQSAKDPASEATALYLIGNAFIDLEEKEKASAFANRALLLAQAASSVPDEEQRRLGFKVEANALDTIGRFHSVFGDNRKALDLFNQALPLRRATGDRAGEIDTLNYMGLANKLIGDYQKAVDLYDQARFIISELGDARKEAKLLNNICSLHSDLGEYKNAINFCQQSLSADRDHADRSVEAAAVNNIGIAHANSGEYQKALDFFTQALAIHKAMADPRAEAVGLNNIGWIYGSLGEYQKAIDFYTESLHVHRARGDRYNEALVLNNIGVQYAGLGEYQKALDFYMQAEGLRRAINDLGGQAITLTSIANSYSKLGEQRKALEHYNQALTLHRTVGNPRFLANALRAIGELHTDLGDPHKALGYLNEGLEISRAIGDRNGEAATLFQIARVERDRGDLDEARNRIEGALAAVEALRTDVASPQLRASFFASVRQYHEFSIDLLMRLHKQRPSEGFDARAILASERARARSLLELLAEARAGIRQGVDPQLLERERSLQQSISDKAERQTRLLSARHTEEQAAAAARELDALTNAFEQVQAKIRQISPGYAALTQAAPLELKDIQTKVLDPETLLLEYALGEERSFLWAATPTSIQSLELPKRAEIEKAARHMYETLTARSSIVEGESAEQKRQRVKLADAQYPKAAAALGRMLLGPVASELGTKRLLIVSEGVLQYVPFAALPLPSAKQRFGKGEINPPPLIVEHEIVTLPSASVLAVLRRESVGRKSADKALAVLADPVFDNGDSRIVLSGRNRATPGGETSVLDDAKRSATESGLRDFVRLRFSRQEADEITRFASDGRTLKAIDFAASRATATSLELTQYGIVHFATHALINNQHPDLSGIVLSLVDEQGGPQNGFLRLYDVYNLRLGADLVVLSACQTALGKEIKGEGLVGLTRGFMYAGVPRIVASLWRIDDRGTAELMKRLYEPILTRGERPAAALRAAQIALRRSKGWESPYYWAAFTLQGEWR